MHILSFTIQQAAARYVKVSAQIMQIILRVNKIDKMFLICS